MNKSSPRPLPASIDATVDLLAEADYLADRSLGTVLYLALKMGRPIFLEGEAGVGKTEIAKVLSSTLGRRLIRLQCYEGLDVAAAVYEWNYAAQMIAIRVAEAEGEHDRARLEHDVFSERFLIKRPLLQALEPDTAGAPVLLIDEIDRTDEAFEAFLLEVLADFQITIPEMGTVKAAHPPVVVITSNRTREVHDALKRRCLYHWVGYPTAERELAIVRAKVPGVGKKLSEQVVGFVQALRKQDLFKSPGVAETLDWAGALVRTRRRRARSGDRLGHARRAPEIPGRHRPARGLEGQGTARRGEVGAAGGGVSFYSLSRLRGRVEGASRGEAGRCDEGQAPSGPGFAGSVLPRKRGRKSARPPCRKYRLLRPRAARRRHSGRARRGARCAGSLQAAGVGTREDFYWTLHAVFVKRHEHSILFDQAFRIFFRRRGYVDQLLAMMLPQSPAPPQAPQAGATRVHEALFSGLDDKLKKEREIELDARMTVSDREVLQKKDFAQMTSAEIAAAKEAMKRLVLPLAEVRTRRLAPHPHGHLIDIRRTLRASMKGGGDFIDLRFIGPKTKPPPIVALLDISGSMSQYSRIFLHFLHDADRCAEARQHVFVRHAADQRHPRAARARSRRCACRVARRPFPTGRAARGSPRRCAPSTSCGRAASSPRARSCC